MNTFICVDGALTRCDDLPWCGSDDATLRDYGFELTDTESGDPAVALCRI